MTVITQDAKQELDKVAEMLYCKPEQVAMIIKDFLNKNCCTGGGCAGNGLCCWYMPERD